jgi:predicted nucleotide-binding protein (sugar kinase/HSP70/actin superfamily)
MVGVHKKSGTISGLKIGIPRAMYHYFHPRLWEKFFQMLDAETVYSPLTSRKTVEQASLISEAEHCLPVKLLDAHVATLVGKVDAVFVPRYLSTLPGHVACAKLGALTDCAQVQLRGAIPVLTVDVDVDSQPLAETLCEFGRDLGGGRKKVQAAVKEALLAMHTRPDVPPVPAAAAGFPSILLVAHPYILHDDYFIEPIVSKLQELQIEARRLVFSDKDVAPSFIKWDSCNKMYHAVCSLKRGEAAGVIQVISFNCGCDSMTVEFFRAAVKEKLIPYMQIMIDEHTSQGGMETRLEAFVDSMRF